MPKVALFLGAGASRAFGYPTTLDFVRNLKGVLGGRPVESEILKSILNRPNVSDIEHVLQKLDPIVNLDSNDYFKAVFKESEAKQRLLGIDMTVNLFVNYCGRLRQTIMNELYIQYEFDTSKIKTVQTLYDELYSILANINDDPELHVFTTNYDSILERYCAVSKFQIEFTYGFRTDGRSGRQFWHSEWLKNWKSDRQKNKGIRLYKLHGSLDWREMVDRRIERVLTEERVPSRSRRYKRNIVIYPAQKHYATEEPFRRLQRYFENVLNQHDICLVIGFSFRDLLINNTFLDFLRGNTKRRLVVVSPNAMKDVNENLVVEEKPLIEQIEGIVGLFGAKTTFEAIRNALTTK